VRRTRIAVFAVGATILLLVLVRTAWLSDDAFITFRTADNFVHGDGLRWNPGERVQTFTHPLWLGLFSTVYFVTREPYYTAIALGILLTMATAAVAAFALTSSAWQIAAFFALALSSKALIDFSTSGLENPLSHLLLCLFLWRWWVEPFGPRRTCRLAFVAALCMVNRMDLAVLVGPALLVDAWRLGMKKAWRAVLVGFLPFCAWEAFSLLYYGFLFPNTAYAKLGTAIPESILLHRGIMYAYATLRSDPATLPIIALSALALVRPSDRRDWPLLAGTVCFGLYVTWIGGDFMLGRFFTCLVVWSAALLAHASWMRRPAVALTAAILALALSFTAPAEPALWSGYHARPSGRNLWWLGEVSDERNIFFRYTGLLEQRPDDPVRPPHPWAIRGLALRATPGVVVGDVVGMQGFFAGPRVHIIDLYGLGDPLLARLPAKRGFRVGHYSRKVPAGYVESVRRQDNEIADPDLARYYNHLHLIVTGPIWDARRLQTVAAMLLGRYDDDVRKYRSRLTADDGGR
jgi:arabinofuranosyltransferase